MSPVISRSAHRHDLPDEEEEDRHDDMSPPPSQSHPYAFSQNGSAYYSNGGVHNGNYHNSYRSGPPSLTPSTPFSVPSVALNTPVSGPFPHQHMSLHYSPAMMPNGLSPVGGLANSRPPNDASGVPWYSPTGSFHHAGVTGGYTPGTAYPFPPSIPQPLDHQTKNGRKMDNGRFPKQEDDEMVEIDDEETGSTLGLSATGADRMHITRREDIRKARIEAEQRRRLHLRAGFDKLCQVLPGPNVKKSKNQILDRATSHIQSLQAAFNKASAERDQYKRQLEESRRLNDQMSAAMAAQTTGARPPSGSPRHY